MQIIVIGNGYDVAFGLPTRYIDYFENFETEHIEVFETLDSLINSEVSISKRTIDLEIKSTTLTPENLDFINEPLNKFLNQFKESNIYNTIIKKQISIWNLFFWFKSYSFKSNNWHSVEETIATIIKFKNDRSALFFKVHELDNVNVSDNIIKEIKEFLPQEYIKSRRMGSTNNIELNKTELFKSIIATIVEKRYGSSITNLFEIYKKELIILEDNFRNYIEKIYQNYINEGKNKTHYRNNLLKLLDPHDFNCHIINFNYTDLSLKAEKGKFTFQRNKEEYIVTQNNVHGIYYDKIMFGIDQNQISTGDRKYIFTKTYRKLESIMKTTPYSLPNKETVNVISFYGHSLSEADYSYFQSIFDFYDIYNSFIKLNFYYSEYKNDLSVRQTTVKAVFKILEEYGNNMFGNETSKGKNLLHKLILEDRLKIIEVNFKTSKK